MINHEPIIAEVRSWIENCVIGLNLCPFAARPMLEERVRIVVSELNSVQKLLLALNDELVLLAESPVSEVETTLFVMPYALRDFFEFNDFLRRANQSLDNNDFLGVYQLASFHPKYQFAGTNANDMENWTNRSPYPIVHILREASIEQAVAGLADPEEIYRANIRRMNALSDEISEQDKRALFPYLCHVS